MAQCGSRFPAGQHETDYFGREGMKTPSPVLVLTVLFSAWWINKSNGQSSHSSLSSPDSRHSTEKLRHCRQESILVFQEHLVAWQSSALLELKLRSIRSVMKMMTTGPALQNVLTVNRTYFSPFIILGFHGNIVCL